MKPPPFAYTDPRTLPEALDVLARHGEDGKVLAGGQSLVPLLNMRLAQAAVLIDINRIQELQGIQRETRNGKQGIAIGATVRQATIERGGEDHVPLPLLRQAIGWVGHAQIRNRGTIGGSIAHADPSAELPLVFLALDGVATAQSVRGRRQIPAADFFQYTFTTALRPDEVLTDVWFPLNKRGTQQIFLEVARRHGDFALVAVAVSVTQDETGACQDVRIAVGGAAPVPVRLAGVEACLTSEQLTPELCRQAAAMTSEAVDPTSDVHADTAYRCDVAGTLVARALSLVAEGAAGMPV